MENRNENSLQMAARVAWKAAVVTSTIAAISDEVESFRNTWSKSIENVDAIIAHNQAVLEEIFDALREAQALRLPVDGGPDWARVMNGLRAVDDLEYPDRKIQAFAIKVRRLIEKYEKSYNEHQRLEAIRDYREEQAEAARWEAYRKANGIPNPHASERRQMVFFFILGPLIVGLIGFLRGDPDLGWAGCGVAAITSLVILIKVASSPDSVSQHGRLISRS